jgi:hypothetical protein
LNPGIGQTSGIKQLAALIQPTHQARVKVGDVLVLTGRDRRDGDMGVS